MNVKVSVKVKEHLSLLGMPVVDKVTGFKGVVTSVSFDLYGCIQAVVVPEAKEDKKGDPAWFDVARLKVMGKTPVMDVPDYDYGPAAEGKKGPEAKPLR